MGDITEMKNYYKKTINETREHVVRCQAPLSTALVSCTLLFDINPFPLSKPVIYEKENVTLKSEI